MTISRTRLYRDLAQSLQQQGFSGEIEDDTALRAAMSTDNSVYQIFPDLVVAPRNSGDLVLLLRVLDQPKFQGVTVTPRGGGTGTNGQSLNKGIIIDMRRHMNRLLSVNVEEKWADVEPGMVLDDLNDQLRPHGLFFAPETSTSTRCTVGGMVATDASGKGSRVYGKTSDNLIGLEMARKEGLLASFEPTPEWARPMLAKAERAAREGRDAFIRNTPKLNRRFTGYDLDRACPESGAFEWWRLLPGSEGTLGPLTRVRLSLRTLDKLKFLIVAGFSSFRHALLAAEPLLEHDPTAVEVMDERTQVMAEQAGILAALPPRLRPQGGNPVAYAFIEFNGDNLADLEDRLAECSSKLQALPGINAVHVARDKDEIRRLWAIRSAAVGLLGKVDGPSRPVAFVEDCVVPPENLPAFIDDFLAVLAAQNFSFGIYGHVDVGCVHIRPSLNIDSGVDRAKLVAVSDAVFALTRKYGGIFWGEHGKGVRGAYLAEWIGEAAYSALCGVKAAFDPEGRFNSGKLIGKPEHLMGIATTAFRPFNAPLGAALEKAFQCNGNAQCLSYSATVAMCPSFKASADVRHSPKGRADALRAWKVGRDKGHAMIDERDLLGVLDTCLGCKACASTCPVQVDIPTMRTAFYAEYFKRGKRPFSDRAVLLGERLSPALLSAAPFIGWLWPFLSCAAEPLVAAKDLPKRIARRPPTGQWADIDVLLTQKLRENAVLIWQDWFTALFDETVQRDAMQAFLALGYDPVFVKMHPAGKAALNLGEMTGFAQMAGRLSEILNRAAAIGAPMIGLDPAFVMTLRQDYPKQAYSVPQVLLPQEFLARELKKERIAVKSANSRPVTLLTHCTEISGEPNAGNLWTEVFELLGMKIAAPSTGCCGMAGMFGHQARHQKTSRRLFEMSWKRHVEDKDQLVVASGFSCRCQSERVSGRSLRHPLGLIAEVLSGAAGR